MVTMQPRPEFIQYRANVPQWRVWNVTTGDFPPFALVALLRDVNLRRVARTAYDMHPTVERHAQDVTVENQITYESVSGPSEKWRDDGSEEPPFGVHTGITYRDAFFYGQSPETYLSLFERGIKRDRMGLATQHWPILTRFVGDVGDITDAWPRYAVADLDNFGVKLNDDGPLQIMGVHPNSLADSELVWIAPRHVAYRDAWATGKIEEATGDGSWQEIKGEAVAVNSPGGSDVLTIEDGRIVAHKLGIYRCRINAVASGDPPDHDGEMQVVMLEPGNSVPSPTNDGKTTGTYGWLPQGTLSSEGHAHDITLSGGASATRLWDRTTSCLSYTKDFLANTEKDLPWQAKLLFKGSSGERLQRIRYSVEYVDPIKTNLFLQ